MNRAASVVTCVVVAVLLAIPATLWMRQMSREVDRFQELSEYGVAALERMSKDTLAIRNRIEMLEHRLGAPAARHEATNAPSSVPSGVAASREKIGAPKRRATLADVRRDWGIEGRLECAAVTGDGGGRRALSGVP